MFLMSQLTMNEKPPTIYSILESIVNFNAEDKTKIKDLSKNGRTKIFDFNYPLSQNISKEEFECMILNKFLTRRIGYETVTAFKIALNVKLNEIMPVYNKMFDCLDGWDLFNDGEVTERNVVDTGNNNTTNKLNNKTTAKNKTDSRFSELPQNQISNIENGDYMTNYTLNQDDGSTTSDSSGSTTSTDSRNTKETIKRSPSDKLNIYKNFIENRNHIYTMIFKELDPLFYGLV